MSETREERLARLIQESSLGINNVKSADVRWMLSDVIPELLRELRSASQDTARLDWLGQKHVSGTIAIDAEKPIDRRCIVWGFNQTPREAIDIEQNERGIQ